jgi:hypothetical protein
MIKTCTECGKSFEGRGQRKVCGPGCAQKRANAYQRAYVRQHRPRVITRICPVCQTQFAPDPQQQHYCSLACRRKRNHQKNAEYRKAHGQTAEPRVRTQPLHCAGGVGDDPRADAREARIAGLAGYYAAQEAIIMRTLGKKTRSAAGSLPCQKVNAILKGNKT